MKIPLLTENFKDKKLKFGIPFLILVITFLSNWYAPRLFNPFFSSYESLRWFSPFILFIGILFTLYSVFIVWSQKCISEYSIAGACLTLLVGMMVFIAIQRFCSGIRFLETYNEIMSIRLANWRSIYPNPETDPVGTVYTPLYFVITSVFYKIFPEGYAYGRLVSLISTLITTFFVYKNALLYYKSTKASLWASVLFLSTYSFVNKSYDKCFVDSLLMCLLTIALYFYLINTKKGDFYAIFFCSLACFTKQTALFPLILVVVCAFISKRSFVVYIPIVISIVIAGVLMYLTNGQLWNYLVVYPIGHGLKKAFPSSIIINLFIFQACIWIGVIYSLFKRKVNRFHYYVIVILATSMFGLFKGGGGFQAILLLEPIICIASCHLLCKRKLLLISQIIISLYNPFTTLYFFDTIHDPDVRIKNIINNTKGDVWLPMETYLYHGTEKQEWDNFCALFGPVWSGFGVPERLLNALKDSRFELIIIRNNSMGLFYLFHPEIQNYIQKNYWKDDTTKELVIYKRR